ncbi:Flavin-containing monooxygenase [Melia azedarach]|uniref:Flavin-containing monooxygenase n=1 Tax=Melia azedarach TaxID=155640 RepID=A0ACC1XRR9_MELAZ|nr:Flavin-containing monooxygenase [Melia azedarach]
MWHHSMIERANEDGTVVFRNGKVISADVIIHCTGYKYYFPFLADVIKDGIVTVDDNRIHPLYKHVFSPAVSPGLSFVGIPQKLLPFPLSEYQSRWIAGCLSNRIELPSEEEMMEDIKAFYSELESSGKPKRHTHYMSDSFYEYMDFLAAQCGCPGHGKMEKGNGLCNL